MNKKEMKAKAQEEILHQIGNMSYVIHESMDFENEKEKEAFQIEAKKQMDRIAKMFGYTNAWFN